MSRKDALQTDAPPTSDARSDRAAQPTASRFGALRRALVWLAFERPYVVPMLLGVVLGVALAERRYGLILNSFLNRAVLDPFRMLGYVVGLIFAEGLQVIALWVVFLLLAKWIKMSDRRLRVSFVITACILVVLSKFLAFQVLNYLGDFVRAKVVTKIAGGAGGAVPYAMAFLNGQLPIIGLFVLCALLGSGAAWWLARGLPDRPLPKFKPVFITLLAFLMVVLGVQVWIVSRPYDALALQLRRTPVFAFAGAGLSRVTDFDRDGVGWLQTPMDFAPFDSARHPYAVEIPNNGIDENGYGGDLPARVALGPPIRLRSPRATPDILVVLECTFRYDLIGQKVDGRPIMPFLESLGEQGYLGLAYSHKGSTIPGVAATLSGDPITYRNSLIRDFNELGYHTITALGQHGSFGQIERRLSLGQSDAFFHAGDAVEDRMTVSTAPSSLSLPAERVIKAFDEMLQDAPTDKPVFAFVLLVSLHYPYNDDAPQALLPSEHVPIADFKARNREAMVRMYNNAAANLDRQIESLHTLWQTQRGHRGTPVFVMLGDHGESFYDDDSFGHGLELTESQTATPVLLHGGWGQVPSPMGQSDLRRMLLEMLGDAPGEANRYVPVRRQRPIFQIVGQVNQPLQIAWVDHTGRQLIDFTQGTFTDRDGQRTPIDALPANSPGINLIHEWESRVITDSRKPQ